MFSCTEYVSSLESGPHVVAAGRGEVDVTI